MWNPYYKKALIRLLLSIPILFILFGSSALSFLVAWSRLSAPGWTDTFAMLGMLLRIFADVHSLPYLFARFH